MRHRLATAVVGLALVAGTVVVAAPGGGRAGAVRSAGVAPSPAASPPLPVPGDAPTTLPGAALPRPVPVPVDSYAPEAVVSIGTIDIPAIGLHHQLMEGITLHNIDHGPSHWPGTALPGHLGNAVFAGHRVSHTHPFRHLDRLVPGDLVTFTVTPASGPPQVSTYKVTGSEVVTPSRVDIVDQTDSYAATLFACHPPGSAAYRFVVHLTLVSPPLG